MMHDYNSNTLLSRLLVVIRKRIYIKFDVITTDYGTILVPSNDCLKSICCPLSPISTNGSLGRNKISHVLLTDPTICNIHVIPKDRIQCKNNDIKSLTHPRILNISLYMLTNLFLSSRLTHFFLLFTLQSNACWMARCIFLCLMLIFLNVPSMLCFLFKIFQPKVYPCSTAENLRLGEIHDVREIIHFGAENCNSFTITVVNYLWSQHQLEN